MWLRNALAILPVLAYATIASAASCNSEFSKTDFPNCALVSANFAVHWKIQNDNITLAFHVDTKLGNWFGFGVSENGGMRGADMVVLANSGGWKALDTFSKDAGAPTIDGRQDWVIVEEPKAKGESVVATVTRKLKTCDADDYEIKSGIEYSVIWAIGEGGTMKYHGPTNRGDSRINFSPTEAQIAEETAIKNLNRSSFLKFNVTMSNYTIPAKETTYTCMNVELPSDKKYHIVEYSPLVYNKYVHHILIYQCQSLPAEPLGTLYDCETMSTNCATFSVNWVPGMKTISFPPEAGFAIGNSVGAMRYAALQMHYHNPTLDSGVVDSSGIELTYTAELRKHDIGIFTIGSLSIAIPAGKTFTTEPNHCISKCTKKFSQNITLLSNQFHMHLLGREIKTQHIRGDKEILPLGVQKYYDFDYQGLQRIDPETNTLVPGDSFITTCTFDGSSRNTTTTFGESSQSEMCFNSLMYYPKLPEYPEICFKRPRRIGDIDYCSHWSDLMALGNLTTPAQLENFRTLVGSEKIFVNNTETAKFTPYEDKSCIAGETKKSAGSNLSGHLVLTAIGLGIAILA